MFIIFFICSLYLLLFEYRSCAVTVSVAVLKWTAGAIQSGMSTIVFHDLVTFCEDQLRRRSVWRTSYPTSVEGSRDRSRCIGLKNKKTNATARGLMVNLPGEDSPGEVGDAAEPACGFMS